MAATIKLVDVVSNADGQHLYAGTVTFRVTTDRRSFDYHYVFADAVSIEAAVGAGFAELADELDRLAARTQSSLAGGGL